MDARRAEEAQKKVAADAAAKAARDAADREREAKRQEAERQRQEALRPPPAPGRLAATVGPISPSDGSALMRDLERSNGRVVKGLSLQWENDRGAATEPSRIQGRGYLRVGGLDDKLVDALCSTARQRSAGCATVR